MGYLSKGYYTICLVPVFSLILLVILNSPLMGLGNEFPDIVHNMVIMGIQAFGITFCVLGWRKHETFESLVKSKKKDYLSIYIPFSAALSILPIVCGSWLIYSEYFTLTRDRASWLCLTQTNYFFHITSIVIGTIGLVSGLIFLVKIYISKSPKSDLQKTEQ